jgi:hypothetical protein
MYQMTTKYTKGTLSIPNGLKVFQMATSYANILNSKDLQKLPRLEFWFAKKNIWQSCWFSAEELFALGTLK